MRISLKAAAVCMATAALLTACSATESEFETTVELKNAGTDCDQDPDCWLPTQFQPSLVSGQSVSLPNEWPLKGDDVKVICETKGETLVDSRQRKSDRWFGILVPTDKLNPVSAAAEAIDDGYLGYVSALWLTDKKISAPACAL